MREKILGMLREIYPDIDFEKEKALVDDELLDSFGIIQFVTALMEEYQIEIDAEDIEPENLNSIEAIVAFVEKKQKESAWS